MIQLFGSNTTECFVSWIHADEKVLSELHRNIRVYRKLSLSVSERLEKSVEEHREILTAIESGDSEEADRLMTEHIRSALNSVLSAVEKKQD